MEAFPSSSDKVSTAALLRLQSLPDRLNSSGRVLYLALPRVMHDNSYNSWSEKHDVMIQNDAVLGFLICNHKFTVVLQRSPLPYCGKPSSKQNQMTELKHLPQIKKGKRSSPRQQRCLPPQGSSGRQAASHLFLK